jgi:hypothetical protein
MGKRKKKAQDAAVEAPAFDEDLWQARQQVEKALMDTPLAKREVQRVKKQIKAQRQSVQAQVRKSVAKKPCPKRRK